MHAVEWIEEHGRFLRSISAGQLRRALDRQKHTRTWCGFATKRPRKTWCSDACVRSYQAILPKTCAYISYRRDRGICQLCGVDTIRLQSLFLKFRQRWATATTPEESAEWRAVFDTFCGHLRDLGFVVTHCQLKSMTEADHIRPVVEGGGLTGVENYRTLCVPCHKELSRQLNFKLRRNRRKRKVA